MRPPPSNTTSGTLTLDAAAQLQHAFERQRRKQSTRAAGAGGGQAGAGSAPPVMAPNGSAAAPAWAAPTMTPKAARLELVAQAAGKSTRQVQEMLAEVDPGLAAPPDRMRPLDAGRW